MAAKATRSFKKYTVQPTGIWATISRWFQIDPTRSSGVPLNPYFRNPAPAGNDPREYTDPVTVPAGDIADNPYWKRDVRRAYPKLSVVSQGDVVGLLTVGSKAAPRDDVLQLGDAGTKQLVEVKEQGDKGGLPAYFGKSEANIKAVLGPDGLPPLPTNMGQNFKDKELGLRADEEQSYGGDYPCRTFG